jgi:hypothetical protein
LGLPESDSDIRAKLDRAAKKKEESAVKFAKVQGDAEHNTIMESEGTEIFSIGALGDETYHTVDDVLTA